MVSGSIVTNAAFEETLLKRQMAMTDVLNVLRNSHKVELNCSSGRPLYVASTERMAVACEIDGSRVVLQEAWRTEVER